MVWYIGSSCIKKGFDDAPEISDHEEDQASKSGKIGVGVRDLRSQGNGRPSQGSGWRRASNSGSTTTSSTGSYCGGRFSPETTSKRSSSGRSARFELGRDSYRPIGGDFDDLDDWESESDEQPAELVPLGMRSLNLSGCKNRHRHRKARNNFNDFYKLTDEHLGSGAYASVRTGVAIATGKEFAVKLVDKHEPGHTRSRIMREVETFNMCKNHPNIVQLHEWFEDHDFFYMVFEKMRGGPLLNHIQQKGFFTEQEASKVTRDIATALKYLHDHGIAHRDVKPENVLCSDFDHVSPVKLCDLDLASKAAPPSPPKLPSVNSEPDLASPVGSAEFMAPEVVDAFVGDALKYDKRCDMWSLGVIVYIMICGYPPFYGQCWRENCGWDQGLSCNDCQENLFKRIQRGEFDFPDPEWENVSQGAKDLICHLLVKNVRERFTADEVLKHPWVCNGAPETKLQTASNLFRNDSARDVHQMQEHFNVMNRIAAARLSARLEKIPQETSSEDEATALNTGSEVDASESDEKTEADDILVNKLSKTVEKALIDEKNNNTDPKSPAKVVLAAPSVLTAANQQEQSCARVPSTPTLTNLVNSVQSPSAPLTPTALRRSPSQTLMPPPQIPSMMQPQASGAPPVPAHASQMAMGNPMMYGGGIPMVAGQHGMAMPMPFHPNQMININGMLLYPHQLVGQQVFPPQQLTSQQQMFQYKYGGLPAPFVAPMQQAPPPTANMGVGGGYAHRGSGGYRVTAANVHCNGGMMMHPQHTAANTQQNFFVKRTGAPNTSNSSMLTVHSSNGGMTSGMTTAAEHLETCQTAMARQDSKGDLPPQARETQVNV